MNMNTRKLKRYANLCTDFLSILNDYAFVLDNYFEDISKKEQHYELYLEYINLTNNLKKAVKKNGFDKKWII